MKAKSARFYGWSAVQIEDMPQALFMEYYRAISVLTSEEQLLEMQIAVSPDLKKEKWKALVQQHRLTIRNGVDRHDGKTASMEDVAKAFARMRLNG